MSLQKATEEEVVPTTNDKEEHKIKRWRNYYNTFSLFSIHLLLNAVHTAASRIFSYYSRRSIIIAFICGCILVQAGSSIKKDKFLQVPMSTPFFRDPTILHTQTRV